MKMKLSLTLTLGFLLAGPLIRADTGMIYGTVY